MSNSTSLGSLTPAFTLHPGEALADELEARDLTQRDLAKQLGMPVSQLNELIKGKRGMNADLALRLEAALGVPATYWMNLQTNFELDSARIRQQSDVRVQALGVWRDLQPVVPVKLLRKLGLLVDDVVADTAYLLRLYGATDISGVVAQVEKAKAQLFRRSDKLKLDPVNLTAWVVLARAAADQQAVASFDPAVDPAALLADLRTLLVQNTGLIAAVQARLAAAGIRFVLQPHLPQTPVDGMTWWCHHDARPAIALTGRHQRLDNFAFTLFHELGHIFLHLRTTEDTTGPCEFLDVEIGEDTGAVGTEEAQANAWAQAQLIPRAAWSVFMQSTGRMQERAVQNFARQVGIHPAVVLGQRCHELKDYKALRAWYNRVG